MLDRAREQVSPLFVLSVQNTEQISKHLLILLLLQSRQLCCFDLDKCRVYPEITVSAAGEREGWVEMDFLSVEKGCRRDKRQQVAEIPKVTRVSHTERPAQFSCAK